MQFGFLAVFITLFPFRPLNQPNTLFIEREAKQLKYDKSVTQV